MSKRFIALLLLPIMSLQFTACMKQVWVTSKELSPEETHPIRVIRTLDGEEVQLDEQPKPLIRNDTLHAHIDGERYSIATDQIGWYSVERTDVKNTLRLAAVPFAIAFIVGIIALDNAFDDFGNFQGDGR